VKYEIGSAGEDDREGLYHLTENMSGITVIGDKGYVGDFFRENMTERGITMIAMRPSNYKKQWSAEFRQLIFKIRRTVETVFSQLCEQMYAERVLAKKFWGLCARMSDKMLALNISMLLNALFSPLFLLFRLNALLFDFYWHNRLIYGSENV